MRNFQATLDEWSEPRALGLSGYLARLHGLLSRWRERALERRQLLAMTDRDLHDLRISRVDAWREANKPLWRP